MHNQFLGVKVSVFFLVVALAWNLCVWALLHKHANVQIHKYINTPMLTHTNIYKYTNAPKYKYRNTQMHKTHKHTNSQITNI